MTLTPEDRRAIEWDCRQLALRSVALNDSRDYNALADLFTEDAVFARPTAPNHPVEGRDAILAGFRKRPSERITRHVCTNIVVDAKDHDHASARMYVTLFSGDSGDVADHGIAAGAKVFIGEFEDDYIRTDDGWRIKRRIGCIIFTVE